MKRSRNGTGDDSSMFGSWFSECAEDEEVVVVVKRSTLDASMETQSQYAAIEAEHAADVLRAMEEEEEEGEEEPVEDYDQSDEDGDDAGTMDDDDDDDIRKEHDYLHHPYETERPWARPAREPNVQGADFVFQHTETSYGIEQGEPVLKIWGVNEKGNSVVVLTRDFKPYFYVDVQGEFDMADLEGRMEAHLKQLKWKDKLDRYVLSTERVQKRSICGYHRNQPLRTMYKVTVAQPGYVATLRDCLEKVNRAVTNHYIRTFEGNVPFELRAMVDSGLAGCQWIRLKANTFRSIAPINGGMQYTLEPVNGLLGVEPIPIAEMEALAPMRYLSFDIECKRKKPGFCKAEEDPCILIAAALSVIGTGVVHKVVFALVEPGQTVNAVEGATVYVFHREEEMLLAFRQYVVECDPDAFTGWNITGFDWPYLFGRAKALGIFDRFARFTRVPGKKAWMRQQTFKSKAHGARSNNELLCEGRFDYDGLVFMLRGQMTKYRSYKLNAICKEVLDGKQKVEVGYQQIPGLHEGTDEDRTRLSHYCLTDALLPLELLNVLMAVINGIEQSRVTGVPIKWLLSRGQGVKTFSNILRYKLPHEVFPSRFPKTNTAFTAGGYVREPIRGYYAHPLATLDFSSLYPSIMQAFNICYSTVESLAWAKANLKEEDYWIVPPLDGKTPNDFVFVKKHIREGILPTLLTALLGQRAYVKNLMKKVDPVTQKTYYNVLDGRQLALKVVCNSVYGFLKAFLAPEPRLMAAVTAWGRDMIIDTATTIETHFKGNMIVDKEACEALGMDYEEEPKEGEPDLRPRKPYDARIIYGDTDSVIVDFGPVGLQDIARYGREAAALCTSRMQAPNSLAFESVKLRSLYVNKKRYASLEILFVKKGEKLAEAILRGKVNYKGLESKRRDNALIGSETQLECLKKILKKDDVDGAAKFVCDTIADLLMDRVDLSKLVISKGLSKTKEEYAAGGTKQTHVELTKRITARSRYTGEIPPETGDRVNYIMTSGTIRKSGKNASKSFELAEDPVVVMETGIPIDVNYYITKQVMAATLRIFTAIWEPTRCKEIKSAMSLKKLRTMKAYQQMFRPELPHMLNKKHITGTFGIGQWTVALPLCAQLGCRTRVHNDNVVCKEHVEETAYTSVMEEMDRRTKQNKERWDRCRVCAGGGFSEVTCNNVICDNFFARRKSQLEIEDIAKDVNRFKRTTSRITGPVEKFPIW